MSRLKLKPMVIMKKNNWAFRPVKPIGHVQIISLPFKIEHTPPFRHILIPVGHAIKGIADVVVVTGEMVLTGMLQSIPIKFAVQTQNANEFSIKIQVAPFLQAAFDCKGHSFDANVVEGLTVVVIVVVTGILQSVPMKFDGQEQKK
jgi:hypothetical protein